MENRSGPDLLLKQVQADIEKRNSSLEEQSKVITSDSRRNIRVILGLLRTIDFSASRLPPDFLEKRENIFQQYGDFETNIRKMITRMENDDYSFDIDISEIDRYLFLIAKMLAGSIASGLKETAVSARISLANGLFRIRENLKITTEPSRRDAYLEKSVMYMSNCYTYVSVKNMIDITKINLEQTKKAVVKESDALEETKNRITDVIIQTPTLMSSVIDNYSMTFAQSGRTWSRELIELFEMIIQTRIAESNVQFKAHRLELEEKRMLMLKGLASKLNGFVTSVPVPDDPNLLDKMNDIMQATLNEANEVQNDFDKLSDMVDAFTQKMNALSERSRQDSLAADAYRGVEKKLSRDIPDPDSFPIK